MGTSWISRKGGILEKWGGGWSRKGGGYDPPYQLWTFSRENYKKLSQNEISNLSSTAADLFNLIKEFAELSRIKDEVVLHFVDEQLQNEISETRNFTSTKTFLTHWRKVK